MNVLKIRNDANSPWTDIVALVGPAGPQGEIGPVGPMGPVGPVGPSGKDGKDGSDGFSPTIEVTDNETGILLTIIDFTGTKTATVHNGAVGPQGETGPQGPIGPQGEIGPVGPAGKDGKDGQTGPAGYTPIKGTDYWTDADKQEIINAVIASFTDGNEVSY